MHVEDYLRLCLDALYGNGCKSGRGNGFGYGDFFGSGYGHGDIYGRQYTNGSGDGYSYDDKYGIVKVNTINGIGTGSGAGNDESSGMGCGEHGYGCGFYNGSGYGSSDFFQAILTYKPKKQEQER